MAAAANAVGKRRGARRPMPPPPPGRRLITGWSVVMVAPLLRLKIDSRARGANPRTRADGIEAPGELGALPLPLSIGEERRTEEEAARPTLGFIAEDAIRACGMISFFL